MVQKKEKKKKKEKKRREKKTVQKVFWKEFRDESSETTG